MPDPRGEPGRREARPAGSVTVSAAIHSAVTTGKGSIALRRSEWRGPLRRARENLEGPAPPGPRKPARKRPPAGNRRSPAQPKSDATEPEADATEPETDATEPEADATEPETDATERVPPKVANSVQVANSPAQALTHPVRRMVAWRS